MNIISWNVNGLRAIYKKNFVPFLEENQTDILCLQETKAHREQLPQEAQDLSFLGFQSCQWHSADRKGYSGVASFFKTPPLHSPTGIGNDLYDREGRIVWSVHPQFHLYNIYFPNGGSGQERHEFKQIFLKYLFDHLKHQVRKGIPIVLLGDFNIAHTALDIYDPVGLKNESGFLPEERQWMSELLELGFIDTFRFFHPDLANKYTWWSYRERAKFTNRGWRLDYICISSTLKTHLKSAEILSNVEGSDHCPVRCELDF